MRVVVIGGTGVLGRAVVAELVARGHTVRVVSRTAPAESVPGVEHRAADLGAGTGLAAAVEGCEAVVDAVSARTGSNKVMVDGVRRLLAAEQSAGVAHHVEISIVGCDLVPLPYYKTKVAQEQVVTGGPVPWTLLRATQFHDLIAEILTLAQRFRIAPRSSMPFQPIDVSAVAARLAEAVDAGPAGRVPDLGGPYVHTLTELSAMYHSGKRRLPLPIWLPGRGGRAGRAAALCVGDSGERRGISHAEWLATPNQLDR